MIVLLGNKARQGKDTVAGICYELLISQKAKTVPKIVHWTDALKEEVANKTRKIPLISLEDSGKTFSILDLELSGKTVKVDAADFPYLRKIFYNRGITEYMGSFEKDPEMLQFWGTDFRRAQNKNYWVDRLKARMRAIRALIPNSTIFIPDTRFQNEYNLCMEEFTDTILVKVHRLNEDGTPYRGPERDPEHHSETDLDNVIPFMNITAKSGDIRSLVKQSLMLTKILE